MERVIQCEDSLEGIFSAIYDAYLYKCNPAFTRIEVADNERQISFGEYSYSESDTIKSEKVRRTIKNKFSTDIYCAINQGIVSYAWDKADVIYHSIALGLTLTNPSQLLSMVQDPFVARLFEIKRQVNNEVLHLEGFLRFKELEEHILYGKMEPKSNIITLLTPHFADRLPSENFIIHDSKRGSVTIHPKNMPWIISDESAIDLTLLPKETCLEQEYQQLFRHFCKSIGIKERYNPKLQRQMLPLRFRDSMIEF